MYRKNTHINWTRLKKAQNVILLKLVTRDEIRQGLISAILVFGFRFYIKTQWQGKLSNGILLTEFLTSLSPAKSLTIVVYSCFFTETTQAMMRHHEFILRAVLKVGINVQYLYDKMAFIMQKQFSKVHIGFFVRYTVKLTWPVILAQQTFPWKVYT